MTLDFDKKLVQIQEFVKDTYDKSGATQEEIDKLNEHNAAVLNWAMDLAREDNLSEQDKETLQLAVALHDVAKFDAKFLKHGFDGAIIARNKLKELQFSDEIVEIVTNAIERHMGPIPGFVVEESKKWQQNTGEKIEFPRPQNIVDQLLYDADMLGLIGPQGIGKILFLRKTTPIYREEDEKIAKERGILPEKVALESAMSVAQQARETFYRPASKKLAEIFFEESKRLFG